MRRISLAGVTAVVIASCGGGTDIQQTAWHLIVLPQAEIVERALPTIVFGSDQVAGTTGCNSFNGPYQTDGNSITIGPLVMTLAACPTPELSAMEGAYVTAVGTATEFETAEDVLLLSADGDLVAEFRKLEPDLADSFWDVVAYNNGREAVTSLIIGTSITLVFDSETDLSGASGCNDYSGTYEVSGDYDVFEGQSIAIGPLASTEKGCLDPAGVMDQEQQYLAALQAATSWSLVGGNLELRSADGALQIQAAPPG